MKLLKYGVTLTLVFLLFACAKVTNENVNIKQTTQQSDKALTKDEKNKLVKQLIGKWKSVAEEEKLYLVIEKYRENKFKLYKNLERRDEENVTIVGYENDSVYVNVDSVEKSHSFTLLSDTKLVVKTSSSPYRISVDGQFGVETNAMKPIEYEKIEE